MYVIFKDGRSTSMSNVRFDDNVDGTVVEIDDQTAINFPHLVLHDNGAVTVDKVAQKENRDMDRHAELKSELAKIKEDIEQEDFGIVRDDYEQKKARAAEIINELRVLEGKQTRQIKTPRGGI